MKKFDIFIIGSGMAGMTIENKCASKGLTVAIPIDHRNRAGDHTRNKAVASSAGNFLTIEKKKINRSSPTTVSPSSS